MSPGGSYVGIFVAAQYPGICSGAFGGRFAVSEDAGAGPLIYAEGDIAWHFYKIESGIVRICKFLADGRRQIAAFLADRLDCAGVIELAMTRQDIADYLGLTIETVSRTLSHLERDGVIVLVTSRRIRLKKRDALLQLNA